MLISTKDDVSLKVSELCDKPLNLWNLITNWYLTSLERGYFDFSFKSMEYLNKIWSVEGLEMLSPRSYFSLNGCQIWDMKIEDYNAQVWLRMHGLSL